MEKLKVLSLFSGIGAFEKALQRIGIDYELINYCEIDKYASKAYSLIHNISEDKNLGDITKVNETELPDFDLMTWGFPCTDISIAGDQKGIIQGETRSGLYYEGLRILQEKKPKYSIIENVKALTQKKFKGQFEQILKDLELTGYNNYWKVLNAKDYGIPQNRERIYIISIRQDIDDGLFKFPEGFDNGIRLKDLLEDEVDEKYYISQDKTEKLIKQLKEKEISNTVRTGGRGSLDRHSWDMVYVNTKILQIGMLDIKGNEQIRRVYDPEGLSPTLNTMKGGNRQPKVVLKNRDEWNLKNEDDIASCLDANYYKGIDNHAARTAVLINYRIRKLTPLECFRLMNFDDQDYYILKNNKISDSQIYKMAGNSIVVGVLEGIFKTCWLNK